MWTYTHIALWLASFNLAEHRWRYFGCRKLFSNCNLTAWESQGEPQVIVGMLVSQLGHCENEACQGQLMWMDGTEVLNIRQGYFDMGFEVILASIYTSFAEEQN